MSSPAVLVLLALAAAAALLDHAAAIGDSCMCTPESIAVDGWDKPGQGCRKPNTTHVVRYINTTGVLQEGETTGDRLWTYMQEEFHSGMDLLGMLLWHAEPKINPNHDEFSVNEDLRCHSLWMRNMRVFMPGMEKEHVSMTVRFRAIEQGGVLEMCECTRHIKQEGRTDCSQEWLDYVDLQFEKMLTIAANLLTKEIRDDIENDITRRRR